MVRLVKNRINKMKLTVFPHLPPVINVKIMRHKDGDGFFAELTDYGVFTEAHSESKLDEMINDLIYELFEVPKGFQNKIRYVAKETIKDKDFEKVRKLIVMSTPDVFKKYLSS